jgi:hypothetical protein
MRWRNQYKRAQTEIGNASPAAKSPACGDTHPKTILQK